MNPTRRAFLKFIGIGGAAAVAPTMLLVDVSASKFAAFMKKEQLWHRIQTGRQLVLNDLIFLRAAGVVIDDETFTSVLRYENMHRDFALCSGCHATTFSQHDPLCRYASVLWLPDWFEIIRAREANR
jgi:hypothetical protein